MCCWCETNHYTVSKQCSKWNNWYNDLFKLHRKFIRIMQTKWHQWCMLITLDRSLDSGNMQLLVNTSLLKVICGGAWLCKLTYPLIYRLTWTKSYLHQTNTILNRYIEALASNLSVKDNSIWNGMITVLSANFVQVSATETECWCKLNN